MDKIASNVHDIVYPSPIPLKELSSIAVAVQLWHLDLNQYLENGNFSEELRSASDAEPRITLRDVIPNIPLVFHRMTGKYLKMLVLSTRDWLIYHFDRIFRFERNNRNVILKDFNDIVCDYDGTIDYVRTAKRMMFCDRISPDEKFKIACLYSFEEYIKQIGPSVHSNVDLKLVHFGIVPSLYYWICYLRNKMDEIPNEREMPLNDLMLKKTRPENRSSFEYFWNRASPESQYRKAVMLCEFHGAFCGRFVLSKLSEQQLTAFVAEEGGDLLYFLWTESQNKEHILPIWMYIKDKIDEANFARLIERMLYEDYQVNDCIPRKLERMLYEHYQVNGIPRKLWNDYDQENLQTACDIWTSASESMKKFTLKKILHDESLFKEISPFLSHLRKKRFLPTFLLDATFQERNLLWRENWSKFVLSTRVSDLNRIMNLCFINKTEIDQFKRTTMSKYENLIEIGAEFIEQNSLKELADVLNFCCPDPYIRADLKQRFLQTNFLGEKFYLSMEFIREFQSLHDFIDGAYADSPELAIDFRNKFLSSADTERCLLSCIRRGDLVHVKPFLESFELIGQNMDQVKKRLVDALREFLIEGRIFGIDDAEDLQNFVLWCLGSDDRVIEFKQTMSPDAVLGKMLRFQICTWKDMQDEHIEEFWNCSIIVDRFLLWYFNTPQKIDEFKNRYAHVLKMFISPPQDTRMFAECLCLLNNFSFDTE